MMHRMPFSAARSSWDKFSWVLEADRGEVSRPLRPSVHAAKKPVPGLDRDPRIGVIHNVRARHNVGRRLPLVLAGCEHAMPRTHDELHDVLANFAINGIDALIIDGGDGTVRDITSIVSRHFPGFFPRIAIVPSGKTNALALDLGIAANWTAADAVDAIVRGGVEERAPIEIRRNGAPSPELSGFIFGAGAYVRATAMAQRTHRLGAFNGLAVGLSIAAAVGQTIFGGRGNSWRRGETMRVALDGRSPVEGAQYMLLASTLRQMPLGIKPFGRERAGLKMLRIGAAPQHILKALPALLGGGDNAWLKEAGYHRDDARSVEVSLAGNFVLDGETFAGGELSLRRGAPMRFVVP